MISFKEAVEFLSLLNKNKVKYLIIGGVAVNIHGYTRATGDLGYLVQTVKKFQPTNKVYSRFWF
jgi:hypothetical protein